MNDTNKESATNGLQAMTDKDVGEYLSAVAKNEVKFANPAEAKIAELLRSTTSQQIQGHQRLGQLEKEASSLKQRLTEASGTINAFTTTLIQFEDSRRAGG